MKKYLKLFIMLLAVIMIIPGSSKAFAGEFKQSSLDGVVFVVSVLQDQNKQTYYATGTGFFVGKIGEKPQYILTNCHVIADFLNSGGSAGTGKLEIAYDKDTFEEAYVVAYDAEKDVAILKLAKATDKRKSLELRGVDEAAVGSSVFAVGYPATADETVNAVDYFGKNDATVTGGRISRILTESGSGRQLLQMDVSINHGSSGGPLIDENGYVVGINTLGSSLDPNLNYAVSIEEAIPLLKNNNIPYQEVEASSFSQLLIPIIVAAGVLLVIIVVVLIIVLGKGKKKSQPEPVIIPSQPMEQPVPVRKPNAVLRSMAGQHRGMTTVISSQPILIGRDPSLCRIIYKDDTPGVSSRHCQIYYDEGSNVFILTDLKSTYGTFLSNGQRLNPNVPYTLRAKDSFFLGDKDNTITLDLE